MIRRIIHFDRKKCSGCGLCAKACSEEGVQAAVIDSGKSNPAVTAVISSRGEIPVRR